MKSRDQSKTEKDYGMDGIDIQAAMVREARSNPSSSGRPRHILWNGQEVWTSFELIVPEEGVIKIEFLSKPTCPAQGFDIKVEGGGVELADGSHLQILRAWHEEQYDESAEYRYRSGMRLMKVWNVYRRKWPDGRVTEEKWTGNSGFLLEEERGGAQIFRCSGGLAVSPEFNQLVFRLSVTPLPY